MSGLRLQMRRQGLGLADRCAGKTVAMGTSGLHTRLLPPPQAFPRELEVAKMEAYYKENRDGANSADFYDKLMQLKATEKQLVLERRR